MIKLEYDDLSGMKSELQGFRDLSAFRHFEIGVFVTTKAALRRATISEANIS